LCSKCTTGSISNVYLSIKTWEANPVIKFDKAKILIKKHEKQFYYIDIQHIVTDVTANVTASLTNANKPNTYTQTSYKIIYET
jgi:hypothetical protein